LRVWLIGENTNNGEKPGKKMKRSTTAAMIIGLGIGIFIWVVSPDVTGYTVPWDAQSGFYPLVLLISGVISGLIVPRRLGTLYIGVVGGQLFYIFMILQAGALVGPTLLFLPAYALVLAFGAWISACLGSG